MSPFRHQHIAVSVFDSGTATLVSEATSSCGDVSHASASYDNDTRIVWRGIEAAYPNTAEVKTFPQPAVTVSFILAVVFMEIGIHAVPLPPGSDVLPNFATSSRPVTIFAPPRLQNQA
ncbi:hypothetical protein HPB50_016692 [Hyalomma asiaticum]|uniref:Uncharacterized protein n=1 Tax=Hyalomma asiaticum TaxID=266040 RepID=A0ACB7T844_HYAAI|nr:hypothetical protein HPB50_016692 [Hyalomma asiaticum]